MRRMKKGTKWLLPVLAMLLILAGCQTVGGLDVNKALLGDLNVKSVESSTTLSLNAVPADGISAEDLEMIELINSFSVNIAHVKLQDNGNVSATGTVTYKQATVPFNLSMDKEAVVLNAEGAKQPFYFPLESYEASLGIEGLDESKLMDISKLVSEFVVKNLPNPAAISATSVSESVYGQQLNLTKLHTEITGDELPALVKSFLKSVSKDTEGFTALIGGLYDYLYPILIASGADDELDYLGFGEIPLEDKEGVVTVAHDAAKLAVDALLLVYDKQLENLYETTPELATVLSKDTKLQVDLFVDSGFHVRKQNIDLTIALPASEDLPLKSISVKSESQTWNVNGPVTADLISKEGAVDLTATELTPGETLRNFEQGSTVYNVLKDDLKITARTLFIEPDDDYYYYPVNIGGTTWVPLRYVAEDLDAGITWNGADKSITVTDDVYGDTIVFKIGSDQALVNGTSVKLQQPVFVDEYGDANVPLRVLAEALHAKVEMDEDGYIWIERP
ncbi:copper amine oxidase N-terminal domain-containing protein [Paenibacillus camerounensis]|uniref:copper amine oxidase N-terminal domain-containing protein n=1 Tax=Paenibacillus camerounensis TaxID=1243663 RepID=UPI0006944EE7|nr:copper amine oxidase N-terminal domain-containing protein [Paenibacillus camerounensis]